MSICYLHFFTQNMIVKHFFIYRHDNISEIEKIEVKKGIKQRIFA